MFQLFFTHFCLIEFVPDFATGESFATFAPKRTKVGGKREHSADKEGKLDYCKDLKKLETRLIFQLLFLFFFSDFL
jgi:hypothetical protein